MRSQGAPEIKPLHNNPPDKNSGSPGNGIICSIATEGIWYFNGETGLTSQNNSLPLRPQNQDIQDTSSELLMVLSTTTQLHHQLLSMQTARLGANTPPQTISKTLNKNVLAYNILFEFFASSRVCDSLFNWHN